MRKVVAILLIGGVALLALAGCAVTVQSTTPPPPARPPAPPPPPPLYDRGIDVQFFYDSLDPYGDWVRVEPYGWVWAPGAVDPFWRPYSVGRWVWTDDGWTWVSTERWGWAAYHYGRWARVPRHGWVWVPGTVWAPAWVAWRSGPGVMGWAPLPPEVGWRVGSGIDLGGLDIDVVIRQDYWCFVDDARVFEPNVVRYAYPVGRNVTIIPRTTRTLRIEAQDNRVVNRGIDVRGQGRAIPQYRIVDDDAMRGREASIQFDEVHMWRPAAREAPQSARPRRGFERPVQAPPPGQEAKDDPMPAKPAPPAVERRIERGWEQDWNRLREMQKKDTPPPRRPPPRAAPPGRTAADKPPQRRPPSKLEREREENYCAAENAYREQQAERARVQREEEKPRPAPPRAEQGTAPEKGKAKGQGKEKQDEKHEER